MQKIDANLLRTIRIYKRQLIDTGYFSAVFRVSTDNIVKVFCFDKDEEIQRWLAQDEIRGTMLFKYALPIIEVVKAKGWKSGIGLVKKYLPYEMESMDELWSLYPGYYHPWDFKPENYRKDTDGTIYRIDCQTQASMKFLED